MAASLQLGLSRTKMDGWGIYISRLAMAHVLSTCLLLCSCGRASDNGIALRDAPDENFLGFNLHEPVNLPRCPGDGIEVKTTCVRDHFIHLQPDAIPDFMEGNTIFIDTVRETTLATGPQYFSVVTKVAQPERVLQFLRKKYGDSDPKDEKSLFAPLWNWRFKSSEVQYFNYDGGGPHTIAVFTKAYLRQRAADAEAEIQKAIKQEEEARPL